MRISECPFCKDKVKITTVECHHCGVRFQGDFYTSPITTLSEDQQMFIELFILNGGRLKQMAAHLGISYPTVRSRLDDIIKEMKQEIDRRNAQTSSILDKVSQGTLTPEKAAHLIKNR
ncbi:MAG: DUF2089 domain-containing protein [Candidatus Omnitrophica bacterium]|nr:DUF2089 domain-containing protein [Candidatus Omnitrophota bacterium]